MKKTITKLFGCVSALALMAGVGVGIGSTKNVKVSADGVATTFANLESGEKYYITATYNSTEYVLKAGAFSAGGSGSYTAAYQGGAGLEESDAWTITETTGGYNVTSGTNYLSVTATNNGLVSSSTAAVWTIAASGDYCVFSCVDSAKATRKLALYNGTNWRCYSSGSGVQNIQLYKYTAATKTLSSIAVTTMPTKTSYNEGDALDLTGAVVTATYSDASTANVTADCVFSPANGSSLSASDTTIAVSYGGKSTSFNITVVAKVVSTEDLYITASSLGLGTSYGSANATQGDYTFGRADIMKSTQYGNSIQFKASSGKLYNKTATGAEISKVYVAFDADNSSSPSNYAVKFSATTAGSGDAVTGTAVDSTNRVYVYDVAGQGYKYFTVARTGSYAVYVDMIVVEMVHTSDTVANVRDCADLIASELDTICAGKTGPTDAQWNTIAETYNLMSAEEKAVFDATVLNTASCNSKDTNKAPVQLTTLQKVISRIEYIVATYGRTNFTSRTMTTRINVENSMMNSNTGSIATIIALISVSSLAAVVILKKKKESK